MGMLRKMTTQESGFYRVSQPFCCAIKKPIAGAERAADATVHEVSLGQTLEKHCFRVTNACGAGIAAEVEA
jgi:hypothetical protein